MTVQHKIILPSTEDYDLIITFQSGKKLTLASGDIRNAANTEAYIERAVQDYKAGHPGCGRIAFIQVME